jgi:hypothetical protein
MSILEKIGSGLSSTSLGRAYGGVTEKGSFGRAFASTPLGGLVSRAMPDDDSPKKSDSNKSADAEKVSRAVPSGLQVSKETLNALKSIDDNLRTVIESLGIQQKQEQKTAEERKDAEALQRQKDEAAAEEQQTEALDADAVKPEGGEEGGMGGLLKKFGKLAGLVAVLVLQFAYPLYKALVSLKDKFAEGFKVVKEFLTNKILPIFTKDIPEFFTETIPQFFSETLPKMFWNGVDWIAQKFSSIADGFTEVVAGIKKKIGSFIVGLSEKSVFNLFPDARKNVRSFGEGLIKSGDSTISDIESRRKEKDAAKTASMPDTAKDATPAPKDAKDSALTPFEKEFARQRALLGPGKTFTWTDPATGKTGKYTTDYKEENPVSPVSRATIEKSGQGGKEYGSAPSSDTAVDSTKPTPDMGVSNENRPSKPYPSAGMQIPKPESGSGEAASPVSSAPSTGSNVAAASMQATAPTPTPAAVAQQSSNGMNKSKIPASEVNPVGNVPNVDPMLGSISTLWYHNAAI